MSVIITRSVSRLEPAMRAKAYAFLEKLNEDHALPGLHIEPIHNSVDSRVRTGRVDQGYRAVLFQLTTPTNVDYVLHGIWPHDDAIAVAKKVRLTLNPISGVPEIIEGGAPPASAGPQPDPTKVEVGGRSDTPETTTPLLVGYGYRLEDLTGALGLDEHFAARAMTADDEDDLSDDRRGGTCRVAGAGRPRSRSGRVDLRYHRQARPQQA